MAEVHNRSHIAVLRGRFTLLPLPPLLGNRINDSFLVISISGLDSFPALSVPRRRLLPGELNLASEFSPKTPLKTEVSFLLPGYFSCPDTSKKAPGLRQVLSTRTPFCIGFFPAFSPDSKSLDTESETYYIYLTPRRRFLPLSTNDSIFFMSRKTPTKQIPLLLILGTKEHILRPLAGP